MTDPKNVDVYVTMHADGTYKLRSDPDIIVGGKLSFTNNHHPGFWVYFHLEDPDKTGYRFPDDPDDALWVQKVSKPGDECPKTPSTWGGFEPKKVMSGNGAGDVNTILQVRNRNTKDLMGDFGYTLRVVRNGSDWWPIDPGGVNHNGSTQAQISTAFVVTSVLVVGVALFAMYKFGLFGG
jgi:hypothetical protein